MSLKEKIHQLVENCGDDRVLYNALEMLEQNTTVKDWWEELPEAEKIKTIASLNQSDKGQTVTHEKLRSEIWAKFTK